MKKSKINEKDMHTLNQVEDWQDIVSKALCQHMEQGVANTK